MMKAYEFVTNTPLRLDEHRGFLVDDIALVRTSPPLSPPIKAASSSSSSGTGMIERCVVVQRQADGFGLTVTGDHPFFVHTVKTDGAAYCAGVRQGDRILKVNGMPVTGSNHMDVVRMISGGQNVVLTLLGKPPDPISIYMEPDVRRNSKIHITEPTLIEGSAKDDWKRKRKEMISQMLDDERRYVEGLRETSENGEKLDRAIKRIASLQAQLHHVKPAVDTWPQQETPMELDTDDEETDSVSHCGMPTGPFSNLADLKNHPAHLATFINFLLMNGNPSSLFFYLITDPYQTMHGNAKEFRRWAFEIFTTFVIPNSPLCLPNTDNNIIQPIDKILAMTAEHITDSDADTLKRVFVPARQRAVADINEQLEQFNRKRELGLGTMFDADQLSNILPGDHDKQHKVGEQMLFRALENTTGSASEFEASSLKDKAIISSLATIIRITIGPKPSTSTLEKVLERYPQLIARDKSGKGRKPPSNWKTKLQVKGHSFVINSLNIVHYCYQCRDSVWGVQPWCYFCSNCDVKVHVQCTSALTDACYPATQKGKIATSKSRLPGRMPHPNDDEEPSRIDSSRSMVSENGLGEVAERTTVVRSQSMNKKTMDELSRRRDRSAPSWGNDLPPADEDDELPPRTRSIDGRSEARSMDTHRSTILETHSIVSGSSSISHTSMPEEDVKRLVERVRGSVIAESDSDLEVETEAPPLEQLLGWDVIRHLKPKEKKRQEVVNELIHTERTHVRNLKILYKVFYKPMLLNNVVSADVVRLLFANLNEVLDVHIEICNKMREAVDQWKRDQNLNGLYGNVGELMASVFDGENGERFMKTASAYCQHQQHALDILRARCKKEKEDNLTRFLAEAEANPICRKLQLKDMIPVEMQRLVKYPLLLEAIAKYTNEPSEEQDSLMRTVLSAKRILTAVNTAKRNAENLRRLEELQRRMDTTPFDKEFSGHDYASLNLTKYRLVHDGALTCRFGKGKMVEMHVVLLETMLVLLTKHSDGHKLQLKSVEPNKETKFSPILPLAPLIVNEKAIDKRTFFVVYPKTQNGGALILELVAATATERKTWFKLMSDQIENGKRQRQDVELCNFEVGASTSIDSNEHSAKVHVLTHPRLVNASEITVQQPTILEHAQPVLTTTERLKRSDEVIFQALLTKHKLLAEYLPGEKRGRAEELEKLTELLGGLAVGDLKQRDGMDLAMSAIVHGNRLLDSINQGMNARKEADESNPGGSILVLDDAEKNLPSVPCYKLTAIAAPLMNHLKALMQVIQDQQNELSTVKQQLYHYKELAESGPHDRSVSEETLTEMSDPNERKLMTKRQRTSSIHPPLS